MAYIERETALKIIDNYSKTVDADGKVIVKAVRDIVDTICPAADVVEVRHSYWQCSNVRMSSRDITCRYCHRTETISNGNEDFKYCPHCGAKMDGKDGAKNG